MMPYHKPQHKQPTPKGVTTLAEALAAEELKYKRFQDYIEWLDMKNEFQQKQHVSSNKS